MQIARAGGIFLVLVKLLAANFRVNLEKKKLRGPFFQPRTVACVYIYVYMFFQYKTTRGFSQQLK